MSDSENVETMGYNIEKELEYGRKSINDDMKIVRVVSSSIIS